MYVLTAGHFTAFMVTYGWLRLAFYYPDGVHVGGRIDRV